MKTFRTFCCLVVLLGASLTLAQPQGTSGKARPTLQVTGKMVFTDGVRRLFLQLKGDPKAGVFAGTLQAQCILPATGHNKSRLLDIKTVPIGSEITAYYIRHTGTGNLRNKIDNIILALRFESLGAGSSSIPLGSNIACFSQNAGKP